VKLIVPVLNRYDLLQRMALSIDHPVDLLIIDNGDLLASLKVPDIMTSVRVLKMPSNQGVAGSWNLGIKLFPFEPFWSFTAADTVFKPGALKALEEASAPNKLTLTHTFPFYQAFSVGEQLVENVGLFDESIYPIYFEDNDYERRVTHAGYEIHKAEIDVHHDNASTINAGAKFSSPNGRTFASNGTYFHDKVNSGDFSEGRWSLKRRRENDWGL
jgi:GT2 family glycosyltransferase